jgi:hypothetical protein
MSGLATASVTLMQTLGFSLYALNLALLAGGTLALGAFTAPLLFKVLPRPQAGAAMTTLFRRFDKLQGVCLVSLLVSLLLVWLPITGQGGCLLWQTKNPVLAYLNLGLQAVVIVLLALCLFSINPKLEAFQNTPGWDALPQDAPEVQQFNRLHTQSENFSKTYCFLCLALLALLPFWLA